MANPINRFKQKTHANGKSRADPAPASPGAPVPYAMSTLEDGVAEIILYGDIVSERPTDWWGDPMEGQFIILSEFLEDFKEIEDSKNIRIRMHSAGGNAFDAMVIHNRLKAIDAHVECIVDGVAMSGGSLIMCAADEVKVFPGSLIMIHLCWAWMFGGYNASEMRELAEFNDSVDRSQAAIYSSKTGISTQELLSMMERDTCMTGQESVDKGFADCLVEGSALDIAASADRKTLYVKGRPVWAAACGREIPQHIPIMNPEVRMEKINTKAPPKTGGEKEDKTMANTLEELRAENPALAEKLMEEANASVSAAPEPQPETKADPAAEERQRIQAIDEISALYDNETVHEAKYGDNPCTAQELAFRAAQNAAKQGKDKLGDLEADASVSGAAQVQASMAPEAETIGGRPSEKDRMAAGQQAVKNLKKEG